MLPILSPSRERRVTVDQEDFMGFPLAPIGRTIADQVVEDDQMRRIRFKGIDWNIIQRKTDNFGLPQTALLDGFAGLMWLWKEAGMPDDGKVWFSRYNLLQILGWVSNGRSGSGGKVSKPSGRHYQQLRDVCEALMFTSFRRDTPGRQRGFNLLTSYDLVDDQPGPKTDAEIPLRSHIVLNAEFVRNLKQGASSLVEMDLDIFLSLSSGSPRALFRLMQWMRHHGIESMPIEEMFHRLGSVQRSYLPAVARKMVNSAKDELIARNVLRGEPDYFKVGDVWHISFPFGDPEQARYDDEVLVREAAACGVRNAQELLVAYRDRFEEVMAALASGHFFRDRDNLGGTLISWTRRPDWELPLAANPAAMPTRVEDHYRLWINQQQDRLAEERGVDRGRISREVLASLASKGHDNPPAWRVEGMVRMRLSHLFDLPDLAWYRDRLQAGKSEVSLIEAR